MIKISTSGGTLDLPQGFRMTVEEMSPIYNDRGTQTLPATIPLTPNNTRLLGAPWRLDTARNPNNPVTRVTVTEGGWIRAGKANVTAAGRSSGVTMSIGFDNSEVYTEWRTRKLPDLQNLPVWIPEGDGDTPVNRVERALWKIYRHSDAIRPDLAIFPIAVSHTTKESQNEAGVNTTLNYWEVLNLPVSNYQMPRTVTRLINDEKTAVNVPEGYGVTPFIRVWRALELVFEDLGYRITHNPFKEDPQLARLVMLNNCADTICTGRVSYRDLMPDSTVEEFLNALWVRFGLVWVINGTEVEMRLIRDILTGDAAQDLTPYMAGAELINYNAAQYLKLSAGTSIEGAAPAAERFEEFTRGFDLGNIAMGNNVAGWRATGDRTAPQWDGDIYDSLYDEGDRYEPTDPDDGRYDWEQPDWWEDEWDDRYGEDPYDGRDDDWDDDRDDDREDFDYEPYSRSASRAARAASSSNRNSYILTANKILAWEFVTGCWYKLDATNGRTVLESSSSFFNWDPQPAGLEALELTSADECVPIGKVNTRDMPEIIFVDYAPLYLTGSRHYHTYIADTDSESAETQTPLSFMWAYEVANKTIGRLTGEDLSGKQITLADGTTPEYSLYFQFKDGLFAKFWQRYDEILRHGNRSVEIDMNIDRADLISLDMAAPVRLRGVRCLIDRYSYTLPAGRKIPVEMTLRTIMTQGDYDIKREQNIPDFSISQRNLEWVYDKSEIELDDRMFDTPLLRRRAVEKWLAEHPDYTPTPSPDGPGMQTVLAPWSALYTTLSVSDDCYQIPDGIPAPTSDTQRMTVTKQAIVRFEIYELYADNIDSDQPDIAVLRKLGYVQIEANYEAVFRAAWIF